VLVYALNLGEVKADRVVLNTVAKIRGDGNAVFARHGDNGATVVGHNVVTHFEEISLPAILMRGFFLPHRQLRTNNLAPPALNVYIYSSLVVIREIDVYPGEIST
jgi:hypothetical protein